MRDTSLSAYTQLAQVAMHWDAESLQRKKNILRKLQLMGISTADPLENHQDVLLFLASHPQDAELMRLVEHEMKRISKFLKSMTASNPVCYSDSGLPFTRLLTRFSHDALCWLQKSKMVSLRLDSFEPGALDLNTVLSATLPSVEREETTAGLLNEDLLDRLKIRQGDRLRFLLNQLTALNGIPLLKDHCWDALKVWVEIKGRGALFSRWYNRLSGASLYYQTAIQKQVDAPAVMQAPLPAFKKMSRARREELATVIRHSLLLTLRETDPSTFMETNTLRLYELDRGMSVAIYGMIPQRQLPVQSYIGYTLFKNGFPAAYGGSWVFGRTARFGLNVFEAFRGGESGYMMCQILRVFIQVFGLHSVDVDPYQFGRDNPDGIRSGAFWFYYRYGFRPVQKKLHVLARREHEKIKADPGYRSTEATLLRFTESDLRLNLLSESQHRYESVNRKMLSALRKQGGLNRRNMEVEMVRRFEKRTGCCAPASMPFHMVSELAQLYFALPARKANYRGLFGEMLSVRMNNPYRYNELLSEVLAY